jgi:G3E family GTPase
MQFTPSSSDDTSKSQPETTFLSLPNGCLCCSIKEPGITAIENMVEEQDDRDRRNEAEGGSNQGTDVRGIDRVVVELTGVADPGQYTLPFCPPTSRTSNPEPSSRP